MTRSRSSNVTLRRIASALERIAETLEQSQADYAAVNGLICEHYGCFSPAGHAGPHADAFGNIIVEIIVEDAKAARSSSE